MTEREIHLRDYLAIIRRHDFIVVVSFLLVFGSALIVSLYVPRIYEASARIEVQPSAMPVGLSNLMQNVVTRGVDQVSMETICKRFTSMSLLSETIRNLKKRMPEMLKGQTRRSVPTAEALSPKIRTKIVPDTRMIEVTVRMRRDEGGSQCAAVVTNELISVMQSHRTAKTDAEMERRRDFIDNRIDEVKTEINSSDRNMGKFLKDSGDSLVWSAQADYIMTRLSNLIKGKEESETLLIAQQEKLRELKARLESEPEAIEYSRTFSRDVLLDKYRTDLVDLEGELAAARAEFGEENPKVKSLKAQISKIGEEMKGDRHAGLSLPAFAEVLSAKTESRNPTYQTILNQMIDAEIGIIAQKAQLRIVEDMLDKLNDEKDKVFSKMPENQFQLDKLRREVDSKVDIYKVLLERKLEAEIWASENSGSLGKIKGGIEIVDVARPESRPVSPRVKFIGAIAGLVGLVVGLAMAFLAEYFENTYQSPEEAKEDLEIPVLGIIPLIKVQEFKSSKVQEPGKFALPVLESPMSPEAESFRTLVTNIEFSCASKDRHAGLSLHSIALLITSSGASEGKSFAAANLAVAMAQTKANARVILVDCDMRKAVQHKIFGADNRVGLTNLLVGNVDLEAVIQNTDVPNLKLISCGPTPPNPIELLKSQKMGEVLQKLREACDVFICDSPPVLPVADSLVLASKLDGVLFVADLNHTPREVIRQAQEQISKLNIPMLGLICNRVAKAYAGKYDPYYHYRSPVRKTSIPT